MRQFLTVDNNPVILNLMTHFLARQGYEVRTAVDGLAALEVLETFHPEVIFIDLIMPKIGGEKLCRILRSMPEMDDVYLVILSGAVLENEVQFTEFGADFCIAKGPFKQIERHITELLEKTREKRTGFLSRTIVGTENVFCRQITSELLLTQRHLEITRDAIAEGFIELTRDLKMIYLNAAAIKLLGQSEEKLLSSSLLDFIDLEQQPKFLNLFENLGETPVMLSEDSPLTLNGRQVLLTLIPISDREQSSLIVILTDITVRLRTEQELYLHRHHLEALGTMAGGVSHDFSDLLTGINGFVELLKKEIPGDSVAAQYLEHLGAAVDRARDLTSRILSLCRQEERAFTPIQPELIVQEVLKLLMASASPAIRLEQEISPECGFVLGDATQLHQVLMNLGTNAIQAMGAKGGTLKVILHPVTLTPEDQGTNLAPGRYLKISVRDNGHGMDADTRARIFDPYFTTKAAGKGTGLGLAVTRGIVESHGGTIMVESQRGKGTVFHVFLPAAEAGLAAPDSGPRAVPEENNNTKKSVALNPEAPVLVVDDNPVIHNLYKAILGNWQIRHAFSGKEALEIMSREKIVVVISDVMMPGMSGIELLMEIKKRYGNRVQIIMVTASEDLSHLHAAFQAGANDFILKPFSSVEILNVLESTFLKINRWKKSLYLLAEKQYQDESQPA